MNIPGQVVLGVLTSMAGIVVFGYYAKKGCDPLSQRVIKNPNQVSFCMYYIHRDESDRHFTESARSAMQDRAQWRCLKP